VGTAAAVAVGIVRILLKSRSGRVGQKFEWFFIASKIDNPLYIKTESTRICILDDVEVILLRHGKPSVRTVPFQKPENKRLSGTTYEVCLTLRSGAGPGRNGRSVGRNSN